MERGRLRHVGKLQLNTGVIDSFGQDIPGWADDDTDIRCSIDVIRGAELLSAQQLNPLVRHKIRIPFRTGVVSERRFVVGTRTFNIEWVEHADNETRMYLDLFVTEVL